MPDRSSLDRRSRRASLVALALATVVTNAVVADGASASSPTGRLPAQADPSCPAAFPVRRLREGQVLNGLTVDRGTTPAPFTATVIGVLDDGIAPGLDMILAEASSPAIDRAHGIWAGMSGSPVYAADGRLVGSVSYGLTFGASPIAGITPAAEMRKLLSGGSAAAAPGEIELDCGAGERDRRQRRGDGTGGGVRADPSARAGCGVRREPGAPAPRHPPRQADARRRARVCVVQRGGAAGRARPRAGRQRRRGAVLRLPDGGRGGNRHRRVR